MITATKQATEILDEHSAMWESVKGYENAAEIRRVRRAVSDLMDTAAALIYARREGLDVLPLIDDLSRDLNRTRNVP